MGSQALTSPVASTWDCYKQWARTARELKARLDRWRLGTLILAVSGAVLVTLGQQLGSILIAKGDQGVLAGKLVGWLGAAAVALSTYFAREALSNESVQRWAKCRSAAESLKASTYLFRAAVPPFDGADRDQKLIDRRAAIEETMAGVEQLASKSENPGFDPSPLSVDGYCQQRVNDQVEYYRRRSDEYQKKTKALRAIVFWLGAIAVLFGVASAVTPVFAGWTAVIATVTAAISSHVQSQRYQGLIATYQTMARRLETLRDKWMAGIKSEAGGKSFIQACEDTLALENSAWVTEWSQQKSGGQQI